MKWDITGKKKVEQAILELISDIKKLKEQQNDLLKLVTLHNEHLTNAMKAISNPMIEIPLVKPKIRDAEKQWKKEKQEKEAFNVFKN